jgi:hypothetical protein
MKTPNSLLGVICAALFTLIALLFAGWGFAEEGDSVQLLRGPVPNEETAIRIAKSALVPFAGEVAVEAQRPYLASLQDGVWRVRGTCADLRARNKYLFCETFVVVISKDDGRILLLTTE